MLIFQSAGIFVVRPELVESLVSFMSDMGMACWNRHHRMCRLGWV